jgi:hypothetical protein
LLLSLENFVIARIAFFVAIGRYRPGLAASTHGPGLLNALLVKSAVGYERVGHLSERAEGCVLVLKLRFLAGGFGLMVAPREPASCEQRAGGTCRQRPSVRAGGSEVVEIGAGA